MTTLTPNRTSNLMRKAVVAALLLGSACNAKSSTDSPDGGAADAGSPDAGANVAAGLAHSFTYTTDPGQETHWCQYMRMPKSDAGEVVVTGYKWQWNDLHHWALYRTTADLPADVDFDNPFDCFQPGGMQYALPAALILAATGNEQVFPQGTGFAFASEEVVIVQAHTLNTTHDVQHPTLDLTLELAGPEGVQNRLGLIQFYDPFIAVPPRSNATAQMRCRFPQDATIIQGTTHQHVRGVGVQVFLDGADGTPATDPVLTSTDWEHPTVLSNQLTVQAGSYARTVCQYLGDDQYTIQGQDKNDNEMCMFFGYYYPVVEDPMARGVFENCVQSSAPNGVGDMFGTGTKSCADSLTCIQSCPPGDVPTPRDGRIDVGKCWQTCMVDSCPTASAPLDTLGQCVQQNCADACGPGGNCAACVVTKCATEFGACQGHTC